MEKRGIYDGNYESLFIYEVYFEVGSSNECTCYKIFVIYITFVLYFPQDVVEHGLNQVVL